MHALAVYQTVTLIRLLVFNMFTISTENEPSTMMIRMIPAIMEAMANRTSSYSIVIDQTRTLDFQKQIWLNLEAKMYFRHTAD